MSSMLRGVSDYLQLDTLRRGRRANLSVRTEANTPVKSECESDSKGVLIEKFSFINLHIII